MHGTQMAKVEPSTFSRMKREIRKAERRSGDGSDISGTGLTIIKLSPPPLARMLANKTISNVEIRAAEDIFLAYQIQAGATMFKSLDLDRVSRGTSDHVPERHIDCVNRYRRWANYWSARAKRGDPTLEIVWAAVVDERPLGVIEADLGLRRHGRASAAVLIGLRDYADRAGWVDTELARRWADEKVPEFPVRRVG